MKPMKSQRHCLTDTAPNRGNTLPNRIFAVGLICELVLVGIYWFDISTGAYFSLVHSLFDLDSEGNIPAWFSSSQLFCVAIAYWSCALRKRKHGRPSRVFFALAGLAAVYVSSDETAQIHERVTALIGKRYVDWLPLFASNNFLWVMLVVALLMVVCQLLAGDLLLLWNNHRRVTLIAAIGITVGLSGGMGVETLGYKLLQGHTDSLWYKIEVTVEEFMEMFGASLILLSALKLRLNRTAGLASVDSIARSREFLKLRLARVE